VRSLQRLLSCTCLILVLNSIGEAKAWRTIKPLHSTREDVEKLLGPPPPPENHPSRGYTLNKHRYLYFLDEGEISIVFAEQDFPAERDCMPTVADGIVLMIHVTLKRGIRLSEFQVKLKRFKKFDPAEPKKIGADAYLDQKTGFMFRTFRRYVDDLWYFPSAKERQLCPNYFDDLKSFAHFLVG
jgi:hypothetical protein